MTVAKHQCLYDIEHALRTIGNHVLFDTGRLGIWHFSFSELEAQTETGSEDKQQITQSVIRSKLKGMLPTVWNAGSDHLHRGLFWYCKGF